MHWMNRGSFFRGRGRSIHVTLCYMNIYEGWMFVNFRYSILTITHTHKRTHTLTHARTRAHTTRTCTCHHRKKSTDKPINKLANKTSSLLFWACPSISLSVRCHGHSNLVIFNQIFSKYYIIIKLLSSLNTVFFCQTIRKKAVKMAAITGLSNLVIIIGFLSNFIYGLLPSSSCSIRS